MAQKALWVLWGCGAGWGAVRGGRDKVGLAIGLSVWAQKRKAIGPGTGPSHWTHTIPAGTKESHFRGHTVFVLVTHVR